MMTNFLLFHSVVESFAAMVAFAAFAVAWYGRGITREVVVLPIAVSGALAGGIDILHLFAYEGVGVMQNGGANLATQYWLAARFIQFAGLASALWIGRLLLPRQQLGFWSALAAMMLLVIGYFGVFPDCYLPGTGLTPFKVGSEWVLAGLGLAAIWRLGRPNAIADTMLRRDLRWGIGCLVAAELLFIGYITVDDWINGLGHVFKTLGSGLLLHGLVVRVLSAPFAPILDVVSSDTDRPMDEVLAKFVVHHTELERQFDGLPLGHGIIDLDRRLLRCNLALAEILGSTSAALLGTDPLELLEPELRDDALVQWSSLVSDASSHRASQVDLRLAGRAVSLMLAATAVQVDGRPALSVFVLDMTVQREAERRLRLQSELLALEHRFSPDGVLVLDDAGCVSLTNPRLGAMLAMELLEGSQGKERFAEMFARELRDEGAWSALVERAASRPGDHIIDELRLRDGRVLEANAVGLRGDGPGLLGTVVFFHDLSERRRAESRLVALAATDALTGVLNRRGLLDAVERLAAAVDGRTHTGHVATVLLLDLDHFKRINDTFGHDVGDEVLRALTQRLRTSLRGADVLGRWGGEEFVAVLAGVDRERGTQIADRMRADVQARPLVGEPEVSVTVSIGVSFFDAGEPFDEALRRADFAMYLAKEAGRNQISVANDSHRPRMLRLV